jgi:hypothetical protein
MTVAPKPKPELILVFTENVLVSGAPSTLTHCLRVSIAALKSDLDPTNAGFRTCML